MALTLGSFNALYGICVDSGAVYVADYGNKTCAGFLTCFTFGLIHAP